jgi:transcriptional regulator with GAF, ATPase, and Fis domain
VVGELPAGELAREFAHAGIKIDAGGPPVVAFDAVTDDLCEAISAAARGGKELVIALCWGPPPTEQGTWRVLGAGASDLIVWGRDDAVASVTARLERWQAVDELLELPLVRDNLIGATPRWLAILREAVEVAAFTDVPVLISGESGTGKELVARLVHSLSRAKGPGGRGELVVVDCAAVPPTLAESTLFGHEKGSFTGALAARQGAVALADGGTLFLDEIGDLQPVLQAEVLRTVQEGTYKPVGSDRHRRATFRLVCATNRDLLDDVEAGRFRRDLYYRIAGWTCALPPLRERVDDVPLLARHFLAELTTEGESPALAESLVRFLSRREYPGNVRELRHVVARIVLRHVGPGPITLADTPSDERLSGELHMLDWRDESFEAAIRRALAQGLGLREITEGAAEAAVRIAVEEADGSVRRASDALGVTPRALQLRRARRRAPGHD